MSNRDRMRSTCVVVVGIVAFFYVLVVNGAIPGITTPALGLALWTSSFSQSFANASPFTIHAVNFGYPGAPAMAFGLSGGLVESWLIRAGLDVSDAYTTMIAMWLAAAFAGAFRLARRVGAPCLVATLAATAWLSAPIVWGHAGFGMLGLGMALLPTYFLSLLVLFDQVSATAILGSVMLAIVAVFMDGYTFMMFAVGSLLMCICAYMTRYRERRHMLFAVIPVQVASLVIAYILYRQYSHYSSYDKAPIAFFRAWGLDISFIAAPTAGVHWLWDVLGLTKARSDAWYYGDGSVWGTTFCLPLLMGGLYGAWRLRQSRSAVGLMAIALFGLYMSLGPTLKIDATRPPTQDGTPALAATGDPLLMPPEAGTMRTGSEWISRKLPGFRLMRASYRWIALCLFGCWALFVIALSRERLNRTSIAVLTAIIVLLAPHPLEAFRQSSLHRRLMADIEADVVGPLHDAVHGPVIAFSPHGNDFLGAYLAARLKLRAFNAGGDKNYAIAHGQWPLDMVRLRDPAQPGQDLGIIRFLLDGTGDDVVIPYFDLFYSAQIWPCNPAGMAPGVSPAFANVEPGADCVSAFRKYYAGTIQALGARPYLKVTNTPWFATIALNEAFKSAAERARLLADMYAGIDYPIVIAPESAPGAAIQDFLLEDGWYPREKGLVWSNSSAVIALPVPARCGTGTCSAILSFGVFGASPTHPVRVRVSGSGDREDWTGTATVLDPAMTKMRLPLTPGSPARRFRIDVPGAATPAELGVSTDSRRLGIALLRIDLVTAHD